MNLDLLRAKMAEKHMSQAQLVKLSGVSESTVRRIMHGKTDVHMSTLRMISEALGIDAIDLLDDSAPVPQAFDLSNVPEISALALEALTIAEADAANDTTRQNIAPSIDCSPLNLTPPKQAADTSTPEREIIAIYRRVVRFLCCACGALIAAVVALSIAVASGG